MEISIMQRSNVPALCQNNKNEQRKKKQNKEDVVPNEAVFCPHNTANMDLVSFQKIPRALTVYFACIGKSQRF